jgi:GT2 family glycosyltransferase
MSFGVVVCAYSLEREDDLNAAIASLIAQSRAIEEILVVIDHNAKLAASALERWAGESTVRVIENDHKQGLSGARNTGVREIKTDVVGFLDDDASAAPDWAERIAAHYEDPNVIGAGGAIDPDWLEGKPEWFPPEFNWVIGCTYVGMPTEIADVRNMIGANMSLRASVFEAVGGFSETVGRVGKRPVGCEETELCIRALREIEQSRIVYDPSALVLHRVPAERGLWSYFRLRCYMEGISKAQVARLAGAGDALSTERNYTAKVLPKAIIRGIKEFFTGDRSGAPRAAATAAGPWIALAGYIRGRLAPSAFDSSN